MKKIILIISLALSVQVLFSGCSTINKLKDKLSQPPAQTQSNSSNKTQTADQSNNTSTNDTSSNTATTDTNLTPFDSNSSTTSTDTSNNQSSVSSNDKNVVTATSVTKISKKDIQAYSAMTKTSLIKALGKNYKTQGLSLVFSNGLSFDGLNTEISKPTIIKCSNNVELMGIKNGMNFDKVQSILGKTTVIKTYLGTKTNTVYKIQYTYGKDLIKVISPKNDGKDSFIEVCIQ